MGTLTIRDLPDELLERLKVDASSHGRSLDEEIQQILRERYSQELRERKLQVLERIRSRWQEIAETSPEEISAWIEMGRP
ncbi:MAG TPA: Arc family DNA-binding protein [Thermoanaerobaculia bacterium]|nr:Arc family DNA-binding protein [Thermoanaerobaculia bacterium]